MWNPIKIEICNLFAHKESVYNFKNNACTVIFGKNETDRGLENNGAGKSTLFEAICIALTNESLRAIKKDSFINQDEEECKIAFDLHNPVLKMELRIVRQFFRGNKSSKVEIWENGELNNQVVSVNEANKRIIELIGINREDLLRYFIIGQDNRYTFFTASDSEKKEIMNRITSADMINPVIEELDLRYKEKQAEYRDIDDEIGKLSDRKELLLEQREEVLANDNTEEELEELSEKIEDAEGEVLEINKKISEWKKNIEEKRGQIKGITVEDTSLLKKHRKELKIKIQDFEDELNEIERIRRKVQAELNETITCPNCDHDFIHESELGLSVVEAESAIKEADREIKGLKTKITSENERLKELRDKILEADKSKELIEEIEEEVSKYERGVKNKNQDIIYINENIAKWEKEKLLIKKRKKDDKLIKSINLRIEECNGGINELSKQLLPVTEEIETIKFWQFNMGRSGFQTYLANKAIKILEGSTNYFLEKMKIDYRAIINAFTILKSGDVREKIDCFITDNGIDIKNFLTYSGGERQRVTLAGILAIQRLINLSLDGKGINMLLLDESLGNIDSMGTMKIVRILEKIGITVILITQNIEDSSIFQNSVKVVKREGISSFIQG